MLNADTIKRIKEADKAGLLVIWYGGANDTKCDMCGRQRGDLCIAIFDQEQKDNGRMEDDPASGEIYILGTSCVKKLNLKTGALNG